MSSNLVDDVQSNEGICVAVTNLNINGRGEDDFRRRQLDIRHQLLHLRKQVDCASACKLVTDVIGLINSAPVQIRESRQFVTSIRNTLFILHSFSNVLFEANHSFPQSQFTSLLVLYTELECALLQKTEMLLPDEKAKAEKNVITSLQTFLYGTSRKLPLTDVRHVVPLQALTILSKVRPEYRGRKSLVETLNLKLLRQLNLLEVRKLNEEEIYSSNIDSVVNKAKLEEMYSTFVNQYSSNEQFPEFNDINETFTSSNSDFWSDSDSWPNLSGDEFSDNESFEMERFIADKPSSHKTSNSHRNNSETSSSQTPGIIVIDSSDEENDGDSVTRKRDQFPEKASPTSSIPKCTYHKRRSLRRTGFFYDANACATTRLDPVSQPNDVSVDARRSIHQNQSTSGATVQSLVSCASVVAENQIDSEQQSGVATADDSRGLSIAFAVDATDLSRVNVGVKDVEASVGAVASVSLKTEIAASSDRDVIAIGSSDDEDYSFYDKVLPYYSRSMFAHRKGRSLRKRGFLDDANCSAAATAIDDGRKLNEINFEPTTDKENRSIRDNTSSSTSPTTQNDSHSKRPPESCAENPIVDQQQSNGNGLGENQSIDDVKIENNQISGSIPSECGPSVRLGHETASNSLERVENVEPTDSRESQFRDLQETHAITSLIADVFSECNVDEYLQEFTANALLVDEPQLHESCAITTIERKSSEVVLVRESAQLLQDQQIIVDVPWLVRANRDELNVNDAVAADSDGSEPGFDDSLDTCSAIAQVDEESANSIDSIAATIDGSPNRIDEDEDGEEVAQADFLVDVTVQHEETVEVNPAGGYSVIASRQIDESIIGLSDLVVADQHDLREEVIDQSSDVEFTLTICNDNSLPTDAVVPASEPKQAVIPAEDAQCVTATSPYTERTPVSADQFESVFVQLMSKQFNHQGQTISAIERNLPRGERTDSCPGSTLPETHNCPAPARDTVIPCDETAEFAAEATRDCHVVETVVEEHNRHVANDAMQAEQFVAANDTNGDHALETVKPCTVDAKSQHDDSLHRTCVVVLNEMTIESNKVEQSKNVPDTIGNKRKGRKRSKITDADSIELQSNKVTLRAVVNTKSTKPHANQDAVKLSAVQMEAKVRRASHVQLCTHLPERARVRANSVKYDKDIQCPTVTDLKNGRKPKVVTKETDVKTTTTGNNSKQIVDKVNANLRSSKPSGNSSGSMRLNSSDKELDKEKDLRAIDLIPIKKKNRNQLDKTVLDGGPNNKRSVKCQPYTDLVEKKLIEDGSYLHLLAEMAMKEEKIADTPTTTTKRRRRTKRGIELETKPETKPEVSNRRVTRSITAQINRECQVRDAHNASLIQSTAGSFPDSHNPLSICDEDTREVTLGYGDNVKLTRTLGTSRTNTFTGTINTLFNNDREQDQTHSAVRSITSRPSNAQAIRKVPERVEKSIAREKQSKPAKIATRSKSMLHDNPQSIGQIKCTPVDAIGEKTGDTQTKNAMPKVLLVKIAYNALNFPSLSKMRNDGVGGAKLTSAHTTSNAKVVRKEEDQKMGRRKSSSKAVSPLDQGQLYIESAKDAKESIGDARSANGEKTMKTKAALKCYRNEDTSNWKKSKSSPRTKRSSPPLTDTPIAAPKKSRTGKHENPLTSCKVNLNNLFQENSHVRTSEPRGTPKRRRRLTAKSKRFTFITASEVRKTNLKLANRRSKQMPLPRDPMSLVKKTTKSRERSSGKLLNLSRSKLLVEMSLSKKYDKTSPKNGKVSPTKGKVLKQRLHQAKFRDKITNVAPSEDSKNISVKATLQNVDFVTSTEVHCEPLTSATVLMEAIATVEHVDVKESEATNIIAQQIASMENISEKNTSVEHNTKDFEIPENIPEEIPHTEHVSSESGTIENSFEEIASTEMISEEIKTIGNSTEEIASTERTSKEIETLDMISDGIISMEYISEETKIFKKVSEEMPSIENVSKEIEITENVHEEVVMGHDSDKIDVSETIHEEIACTGHASQELETVENSCEEIASTENISEQVETLEHNSDKTASMEDISEDIQTTENIQKDITSTEYVSKESEIMENTKEDKSSAGNVSEEDQTVQCSPEKIASTENISEQIDTLENMSDKTSSMENICEEITKDVQKEILSTEHVSEDIEITDNIQKEITSTAYVSQEIEITEYAKEEKMSSVGHVSEEVQTVNCSPEKITSTENLSEQIQALEHISDKVASMEDISVEIEISENIEKDITPTEYVSKEIETLESAKEGKMSSTGQVSEVQTVKYSPEKIASTESMSGQIETLENISDKTTSMEGTSEEKQTIGDTSEEITSMEYICEEIESMDNIQKERPCTENVSEEIDITDNIQKGITSTEHVSQEIEIMENTKEEKILSMGHVSEEITTVECSSEELASTGNVDEETIENRSEEVPSTEHVFAEIEITENSHEQSAPMEHIAEEIDPIQTNCGEKQTEHSENNQQKVAVSATMDSDFNIPIFNISLNESDNSPANAAATCAVPTKSLSEAITDVVCQNNNTAVNTDKVRERTDKSEKLSAQPDNLLLDGTESDIIENVEIHCDNVALSENGLSLNICEKQLIFDNSFKVNEKSVPTDENKPPKESTQFNRKDQVKKTRKTDAYCNENVNISNITSHSSEAIAPDDTSKGSSDAGDTSLQHSDEFMVAKVSFSSQTVTSPYNQNTTTNSSDELSELEKPSGELAKTSSKTVETISSRNRDVVPKSPETCWMSKESDGIFEHVVLFEEIGGSSQSNSSFSNIELNHVAEKTGREPATLIVSAIPCTAANEKILEIKETLRPPRDTEGNSDTEIFANFDGFDSPEGFMQLLQNWDDVVPITERKNHGNIAHAEVSEPLDHDYLNKGDPLIGELFCAKPLRHVHISNENVQNIPPLELDIPPLTFEDECPQLQLLPSIDDATTKISNSNKDRHDHDISIEIKEEIDYQTTDSQSIISNGSITATHTPNIEFNPYDRLILSRIENDTSESEFALSSTFGSNFIDLTTYWSNADSPVISTAKRNEKFLPQVKEKVRVETLKSYPYYLKDTLKSNDREIVSMAHGCVNAADMYDFTKEIQFQKILLPHKSPITSDRHEEKAEKVVSKTEQRALTSSVKSKNSLSPKTTPELKSNLNESSIGFVRRNEKLRVRTPKTPSPKNSPPTNNKIAPPPSTNAGFPPQTVSPSIATHAKTMEYINDVLRPGARRLLFDEDKQRAQWSQFTQLSQVADMQPLNYTNNIFPPQLPNELSNSSPSPSVPILTPTRNSDSMPAAGVDYDNIKLRASMKKGGDFTYYEDNADVHRKNKNKKTKGNTRKNDVNKRPYENTFIPTAENSEKSSSSTPKRSAPNLACAESNQSKRKKMKNERETMLCEEKIKSFDELLSEGNTNPLMNFTYKQKNRFGPSPDEQSEQLSRAHEFQNAYEIKESPQQDLFEELRKTYLMDELSKLPSRTQIKESLPLPKSVSPKPPKNEGKTAIRERKRGGSSERPYVDLTEPPTKEVKTAIKELKNSNSERPDVDLTEHPKNEVKTAIQRIKNSNNESQYVDLTVPDPSSPEAIYATQPSSPPHHEPASKAPVSSFSIEGILHRERVTPSSKSNICVVTPMIRRCEPLEEPLPYNPAPIPRPANANLKRTDLKNRQSQRKPHREPDKSTGSRVYSNAPPFNTASDYWRNLEMQFSILKKQKTLF